MEYKELFDLHEKLETRINAYWTYWSVAVIAMGGWLFSGKSGLNGGSAAVVAVGATAFFLCNLAVLWQATQLVVGVRDEIRLRSAALSFASQQLRAALSKDDLQFRLQITVLLHLVIDAVVLWSLFHAA